MKKVLDKDLEKKMKGIIRGNKDAGEKAADVVSTLVELQDASGLKVCQNVNPEDAAYREVK